MKGKLGSLILGIAGVLFAWLALWLRLGHPGDAGMWPWIYLSLSLCVLFEMIAFRKWIVILLPLEVVFALCVVLTLTESFFALREKREARAGELPGRRNWMVFQEGGKLVDGEVVPYLNPQEDVTQDARLGLRMRPGIHRIHRCTRWIDGKEVVSFEAEYMLDEDGFRRVPCRTEAAEFPPVLLFGCSFTFGEGVSQGEEFASVLSERFCGKRNVYNFGQSGWSLTEILCLLQDGLPLKEKVEGGVAFVLLIDDQRQRTRNNGIGKVFRKGTDGTLELVSAWNWLYRRVRNGWLWKSRVVERLPAWVWGTPPPEDTWLTTYLEIQHLLQEKYHCSCTAVLYPDCSEEMETALRKASVEVLCLKEAMPDYKGYHTRVVDPVYEIPRDGHPNSKTHRIIAEFLAGHLLDACVPK